MEIRHFRLRTRHIADPPKPMEIKMRDEMDMRMWNAHHREFSDDLARGFAAIGEGFRKLTAIQYAAPWNAPEQDCRS